MNGVKIISTGQEAIIEREWKEPSGMCYSLIDSEGNPIWNRSLRTFYKKDLCFDAGQKHPQKTNQLELF